MILFERPITNCRLIKSKLLLYRVLCLCSGALLLVIFRLKIMNFSGPQFQRGDNPTSFEKWWYIRTLNFNYIYAINAWILIYPEWLCFDWSMDCIPLIKSFTDFRILLILIFWMTLILLMRASLLNQNPNIRRYFRYVSVFIILNNNFSKSQIKIGLIFVFVPFIPSSNVFFTVGFVVAERALFLSSFGYVLLLITGIDILCQRFQMYSKVSQLKIETSKTFIIDSKYLLRF